MALVTFSDHTTLLSPPTHDLDSVLAALDRAHTGPQGTALADAVACAIGVAKTIAGPPGVRRPPATIAWWRHASSPFAPADRRLIA